MLRFSNGGLGQNRTADTRIFNTRGTQNLNVYGACSEFPCHVLQTVLHKNHTFLHCFRKHLIYLTTAICKRPFL